jgi:chromosome segregation ATPase
MKRVPTCLALGLAASLALSACKSSDDKGQATGASITKAADLIDRGIHEIDLVVASLHNLTDAPAADLVPQRKDYEKALSTLESTAEEVSKTGAQMRERGAAYFAEWEQQLAAIQNEDIREQSSERRKEIQENFSELQTNYGEAKTAFEPLLSDLRDIRTALQADLTLPGIETLKPVVKDVDKKASNVREELQDLSEGFRELGVTLSRAGPPPATPPTTK